MAVKTHRHTVLLLLLPVLFGVVLRQPACRGAGWRQGLYLARGGIWHTRVPITIQNRGTADAEGRTVALSIGVDAGQAAIAGKDATSVRLVDETGTELLFTITTPDGGTVSSGPIPPDATLSIPATCPPAESVVYYLYLDNPDAWEVPDFLAGISTGDLNGDFEQGDGVLPRGWQEKLTDAKHTNHWVAESPRSGQKCLKTVVAQGAEPTWVGVHRTGIQIIPGATYTLRVWVRGRDVDGRAGWYIHVGNEENSMVLNDLADAGQGTFEWKQISMTFTVPENAYRLGTGSVLRGTGTAWFDDLTIETDAEEILSASAGKLETFTAETLGENAPWPEDLTAADGWNRRVPVRVANLEQTPTGTVLAGVNCQTALRDTYPPADIRVRLENRDVPFCLVDGNVLFECNCPAQTLATYYLYVREGRESAASRRPVASRLGSDIPSDQVLVQASKATDPAAYAALMLRPGNLARNPSFEQGNALPDDWPGTAEKRDADGVRFERATPGAFGSACARFSVPHDARKDWVGWRQNIAVRPDHNYLYAAWVKCRDVQGGTVKIHAHQRTAAGQICSSGGYLSAGTPIAGDTEWTPMIGFTTTPADCDILQIHLTMNATGTLMHDGVLVAECLDTTTGPTEYRATQQDTPLIAWQVNPVVKVFRETIPPDDAGTGTVAVSLARNEDEPIQLAIRSAQDTTALSIRVDVPRAASGKTLPDAAIGVVGYVPIDHKTSYFRSMSPPWHRKFPRKGGSSDGWPGWWPDPIRPADTVVLRAQQTQPLWLTVHAPDDAQPGHYKTTIRLLDTAGAERLSLPVTITVWDFRLPDTHELAAIYDLRVGPQWIAADSTREQATADLMRFMASRKVSPDRVQAEPAFTREGDAVVADFRAYDRAAELYFDELHFPKSYTPRLFYLFGWAYPPKKILGEAPYDAPYPYENVDRAALRPEYRRVYQACLRLYWQHMKEKGWADRIVLYISDEPHFTHEYIRTQMKALCDMIHEVDPDIPIYSSTWRHCPDWDGYIDVWGVGQYGCFPLDEMKQRVNNGDRLWFTTDGQMCTDTPYCAIERLLPHYCFAYGVEAYEFWGLTWLTYNPWEFGWHSYKRQASKPGDFFYVRYPNGDGFLLYPGAPVGLGHPASTIRLEQARDGVEDFEYMTILRRLADDKNDREAKDLLNGIADMVPIPNAGGRYSTRILPDPDAVQTLRADIANAILRLKQ